jgi:hypothetical protein
MDLSPNNKARLLSCFVGGCPQGARIARGLAHQLLVGSSIAYSNLPPLEPLIDLLSTNPSTPSIFTITDETDYEDLGAYVDILAVALNDVDAYVRDERRIANLYKAPRASNGLTISPSKAKEKPLMPMEVLHTRLEQLQGLIGKFLSFSLWYLTKCKLLSVDTRAAHLDRSRTKAALQRLSMRIHYQRTSAKGMGSGIAGKPRRIGDFFGTPTATT